MASHTCPFCIYDLSGNTTGSCPECGRPVHRFTDRARAVVAEANRHALCLIASIETPRRFSLWWNPRPIGRPEITPGHILLGILTGPQGVGYHAIKNCGAEIDRLRDAVISRIPRRAPHDFPEGVRLPLSQASHQTVKVAIENAVELRQNWVGTEHLLLALCRDTREKTLKRQLADAGVLRTKVHDFIVANMSAVKPPTDK